MNQPEKVTYEEMMEAFKAFDRDNAGTISSSELRQLLVTTGDMLREEDADTIVANNEDVHNGTVGYQNMIKSLMASCN